MTYNHARESIVPNIRALFSLTIVTSNILCISISLLGNFRFIDCRIKHSILDDIFCKKMLIFPWTYNLWFAQYEVRATSSTLQWHMMQYFSQRKNDREWMPVFVITGKQLALQWRISAGNFLLFIAIFSGISITSYQISDILMKEFSSFCCECCFLHIPECIIK